MWDSIQGYIFLDMDPVLPICSRGNEEQVQLTPLLKFEASHHCVYWIKSDQSPWNEVPEMLHSPL